MAFPTLAELLSFLYLDPKRRTLNLYATARPAGAYFVWERERLLTSKIRRFALEHEWPFRKERAGGRQKGRMSAMERETYIRWQAGENVPGLGNLETRGTINVTPGGRCEVLAQGWKRLPSGNIRPVEIWLGDFETKDQGARALSYAQTGREDWT